MPAGVRHAPDRALWRLVDRRLGRRLPGDAIVPRDPALVRVRKPAHVATPGPNAPLLMRIVRYPFRLDAGRPRRQPGLAPYRAGGRPVAFTYRPSRAFRLPDEP